MTQASRFNPAMTVTLGQQHGKPGGGTGGDPGAPQGDSNKQGPSPGDPEQGATRTQPDKEQVKPQSPKRTYTCN